jgi:hypothetical protein
MVNTKLRPDDTTLEALSVVDEHLLLLASTGSDRPLYEDGDDVRQHEHNRPPSKRAKREQTTLGNVDEVRAQALADTLRHGLNQLLKQPTEHVSDVQRHFTADESFAFLEFPSEIDLEDEYNYQGEFEYSNDDPRHEMELESLHDYRGEVVSNDGTAFRLWRFLLPWSDVYRKSLPEPSRYRPINRAPDPSRDDPDRTDMTLESALLHLKPLDVNANNYFPDSATYVGDAEPEFRFDFLDADA